MVLALLLLHSLVILLLIAVAIPRMLYHVSSPERPYGWHAGCAGRFHNDKDSRRAQHRCPRWWAPGSSPGGRLPSSVVPTGNTRTRALLRQSRHVARGGCGLVTDPR